VFSGLVIGALVLGLTTLNAMVSQSSFRLDDLSARVDRLSKEADRKQLDVARLSAPGRIAAAAHRLGLHLPEPGAVQVIHVPGPLPGAGADHLRPTVDRPAGDEG
jgi:outer membrane murein-binding lipoprotein Lpp